MHRHGVPAHTVQNCEIEMICIYTWRQQRLEEAIGPQEGDQHSASDGGTRPWLQGSRTPGAAGQCWCRRNHLAAAQTERLHRSAAVSDQLKPQGVEGVLQYGHAAAVAGVSCQLRLRWPSRHMYTLPVRRLDTPNVMVPLLTIFF